MQMISSSPPAGDTWADIGMSELGGEVAIRAVANAGEPHFISVSVDNRRGRARISRISCCEHLELLAEQLLREGGIQCHRS
jgi:hypothetical protein